VEIGALFNMHHWPKGDGRPCRQREKQAKRRTNNVRELGRSIQMAIELKALCSRSWYRKADFTKEKILTRREVSCPTCLCHRPNTHHSAFEERLGALISSTVPGMVMSVGPWQRPEYISAWLAL